MRHVLVACLLVSCAKHRDDFHVAAKPGLAIAVCAAYVYDPKTTGAIVVEPNGKAGGLVAFRGTQFNVHRGDCLTIAHPTIHWSVDGARAFVGLGDDPAIGARSARRMSQYDALYAGDELLEIPLYEAVMSETLWLGATDRDLQRRLFERLTGSSPPP